MVDGFAHVEDSVSRVWRPANGRIGDDGESVTRLRLLACAILFTLVALHGRRNVRAVFERKPVAGAPIVSLLRTDRTGMAVSGRGQ